MWWVPLTASYHWNTGGSLNVEHNPSTLQSQQDITICDMLRDIENENLCDFQPKKRNLERQCDQCNVVCFGILQFTSHKKSHLNYNSMYV